LPQELVVLIAVIQQKRHKCYSIPPPVQVFGQKSQRMTYRMMNWSVWNVINRLPSVLVDDLAHFLALSSFRPDDFSNHNANYKTDT